jgi:hypothetical protein
MHEMPEAPETPEAAAPCSIPPIPPARGYESTSTTELRPRYDDVSQDGKVQLTTMMPGLGAVWRSFGETKELGAWFREQGILPVLRRLVIAGEGGPFSAGCPLESTGTWRLARETGGDRIFLDMWLEVRAPNARTLAPPPAADAPRVLAGRIHAEHVLTKPFAPPGERKVTRIDVPGLPSVPDDTHPFEEAEALVAGLPLERIAERRFGAIHTDSNQHVNSLVYARLFEEAVVAELFDRASELGLTRPADYLSRALEIRWRKPLFAGDRAAILLHLSAQPTTSGPPAILASGCFLPADAPPDTKPSCTIRMLLRLG